MRESVGTRTFRVVVVAFLGLFVGVPLYVMATSSLKPLSDVQGLFTWIPSRITVEPFFAIWKTVPLAQYFMNSLVVSLTATIFSVLVAILAAYAISRWAFKGRGAFTTTVLATQMFPGVLFLLPLYIIFVNIDSATGVALVGTRAGLIITYLTFSLPFAIWMLTGYFNGIPRELDEAARVDGCTHLGAFRRVIMPVMWPGVITTGLFSFLLAYNDFLVTSLLLDAQNQTMVPAIASYFNRETTTTDQVQAVAAAVSITAPLFLLVMVFQRQIVSGLTAGAVKG
jgi:multiple sugar transport system permease protein